MDTLQGCYHHSPHNHRHFAALYLLLRVLSLVLYFNNDGLLYYSAVSALFMLCAVAVAIFKPYKRVLHSYIDIFFLTTVTLATLFLCSGVESIFVNSTHSFRDTNQFIVGLTFVVSILPLYGFSLLLYNLLPKKVVDNLKRKVHKLRGKFWSHQHEYGDIDELPHRLLNTAG